MRRRTANSKVVQALVKFLNEKKQREIFRERYLDTHGIYLKSVADIIAYLYKWRNPHEERCTLMISRLLKAGKISRRKDVDEEESQFRNLRNSWYHECSLNYPPDSLDERSLFAAWKIIQCYYAVFSSVASLVTCIKPERKSHDATLNIFAREFLCNRKRKAYFLPPANFYLNQQGRFPEEFSEQVNWPYADEYHIPNIIRCLEEVRKEDSMATIPHYLKELRDWVTYGDAYLFIRLYGASPKEQLDFSLQAIAFIYCVQSEFFLLRLFGWNAVYRQFEYFLDQLESNLGIRSEPLAARFAVYSEIVDEF